MEFLNDRIGILLKYGKVLGSLTKRFFYVDNSGNLYYTEDEKISKKFIESNTFKDQNFINIISPISKIINLTDCSVSAIKQFLDDKFNLKGRSYFELYLKNRDYRTILIFSWSEEHIGFLRDYFLSLSNLNDINCLNDNFGKYDYDKNNLINSSDENLESEPNESNPIPSTEFNIGLNMQKSNQKIFEFADISSINAKLQDKNNLSKKKSISSDNSNFEANDEINCDDEFLKNRNKSKLNKLKSNYKNAQENLDILDTSENKKNILDDKDVNNNNVINAKNFSFKSDPIINLTEKSEKDITDNLCVKQNNLLLNKINSDFKKGIDNLNTRINADENYIDEIKNIGEYNTINNYKEMLKNKINHLNLEERNNVENLLNKLNGRFVNQIDWDKTFIKIVKPSQNDLEYEESWAKLENGSDYSGHVINFMPNGQGKEYRQDGIFYTGEFKNGKWHGQGVITNVNLDTFQGEFVNGCICGI